MVTGMGSDKFFWAPFRTVEHLSHDVSVCRLMSLALVFVSSFGGLARPLGGGWVDGMFASWDIHAVSSVIRKIVSSFFIPTGALASFPQRRRSRRCRRGGSPA